jgi:hypothetical protein
MTRLAAIRKRAPRMYEADFQKQVIDLALLRNWDYMHINKVYDARGYHRTPVIGTIGAGWPDLVLIRTGRLVFAELKRQGEKPTGLQSHVLGVLGSSCAEVYVWRPADWPAIMEILR